MRRSTLRVALLVSVLGIVLVPHDSPSQGIVEDVAARRLLATNVADAFMNPPKGEDTEFFIRSGGIPNILFLIDSSGSMERLPPDGPAFYGGTSPTMPPGALLTNPGSSTAQTTARNARTIVGCGLDSVSSSTTAFADNEMILHVQARKFYPPCGEAQNLALVGAPYAGHAGLFTGGADYAYEASICPYYTEADSQHVDPAWGGYDPDFYNPSPNENQKKNVLWVKDLVYHDNTLLTDNYGRTTQAFSHNFGKGWSASSSPPVTYPYKASSTTYATIDQFCNEQGTTALANGQVPADVCKQCLKQAGWYYDGVILQGRQDASSDEWRYPSIWYTGNYLNFFPPKFVIMRKVVKDIVATQSKVRMALAHFGSGGMDFTKEFNPTCAHPDSSFDSNRSTYVTLLNNMTFSGGTPLSVSLFDVGRYYHSPELPWFGSDWDKPTNGSETWYSSDNSNDYAICYSCQTSSVIVLTDGLPSPSDGSSLPPGDASIADSDSGNYAGDTGTGILGASTTDCPGCGAFSGSNDYKNNLTRVSFYLHNYDLRDNNEDTKDCQSNGGKQTLDVYTVGYSTRQLADANTLLANSAAAGGGLFVAAENPQLLKEGLMNVIEEIDSRSTSFSMATVSALQTSGGHAVVVPRFEPAKSPFWEGHLYRYELYSEFVNACDPARADNDPLCCSPNGAGDFDCDGECVSVFLHDAGDPSEHDNPFFVQEGTDGTFYRNPNNRVSCDQAPRCGGSCDGVGNEKAKPWWDAAAGLEKKAWTARKIFTVVDSDDDGRIDQDDDKVPLDSSGDVAATAILPYLGNASNRVCNTIANRIETAGDAVTASVVRESELDCAKTVIRWVLGADVFNEAARRETDSPPWPPPRPDMSRPATVGDPDATPPVEPNLPDQEALPDRPFKLGDVFHSSPVVVDAPLPRTGILCRLGLHNQCLQALWRTTEGGTDDAEYDDYSAHYAGRRKVILVGSNDGLLHAFNGGAWHEGERDPFAKGIDTSRWPFNGYYDRGYPTDDPDGTSPYDDATHIWAEEIWAFLPPDMIPKLQLMFAGEHQLFVDGSAMVRDIWVDGTGNALGDPATADDLKQSQEFHTVAIVGERRGGTHYFALDVSDATKLPDDSGYDADDPFPDFLWLYPNTDDVETLSFGETYTEFLPVPPPVGPVRIKTDDPGANTPEHEGVAFHEVWIAALSGGYDPQYVRGRGIHMVNAWTGNEVWDFSYPTGAEASPVSSDDPRWNLSFPIPATLGMVMWGPGSRRENGLGYANGGFFDTATFGDAGGQLWVLRFHEPGELGADGKVGNWYGARAFQMGERTNTTLGWAYPFFYITANTALPNSYIYRAYLGTGDRFNLLDTDGGICAPDNVRACAMRGCTVTVDEAGNYLSAQGLGKLAGSQVETATGDLSSNFTFASATTVETRARIVVSDCPSPDPNSGPTGFTKDITVTCGPDAQGRWGCAPPASPVYGDPLTLSNTTNAPATRNWYFSVKIFDDVSPRIPFTSVATAKTYDDNRLWISDTGAGSDPTQSGGVAGDFTIMAASDANPSVPPDPSTAAGWAIYYDHGPTVEADDHVYDVNPLDERTSSVSALSTIITWNTMQTSTGTVSSATGNCFASKCTGANRRVAYHYGAHPLTGGSVLRDENGNTVRAQVGNSLVPAQGDQPTVFVNQKGEVLVGLTVVNPEKGARSVQAGSQADVVTELGWIEVSESTHACRHATTEPEANVCR
jgi:type IV pilus assembly protein PilY1